LDAYSHLWQDIQTSLEWKCVFVLPFWLETVANHLGYTGDPLLLGVYDHAQLIGIAPFAVKDGVVRFLGNPEVCDYQDVIAAPGAGLNMVRALLDHLKQEGLEALDLRTLRPEAEMLKALRLISEQGLVGLNQESDDVTFEVDLPATWETYLEYLNGKQRHEVRRKIRHLEAAGPIGFEIATPDTQETFIDAFIALFRSNREDKAAFMTEVMADYFRSLMHGLAEHHMLRLLMLTIKHQPAAAVLCFDHNGIRYLYNSGYALNYQDLSVGILSKTFSIRQGIEMGCRRYDFLKGAEIYKKRIGGHETPLYRCRIKL
jgi:CelD/BcsL family acetyltransferase involved in cellulose biosynthesis